MAKKIINKHFLIKDKIYHIDVLVIIGSHEYKEKILSHRGLEYETQKNYGGETCLVTSEKIDENGDVSDFNAINVLWMPDITFKVHDYGTLAHEVLHCVINTFNLTGVKIEKENPEPTTYYFDFLFCEILSNLFKIYDKI
jgi:hypothetical protein